MDRIDLHILEILQEDASATVADIAAQVGLSPTPCWKRVQKLEATGVLQKRVAIVSPQKVGIGLTVNIAIQAGDHAAQWHARLLNGEDQVASITQGGEPQSADRGV